jgi:phosphoserine aminotransferase
MSSHILSKPIDVSKFALIYAARRRTSAPRGSVVVIVREDLLGPGAADTPNVVDYKLQSDAGLDAEYAPTFSVYLAGLTFQWLLERGGLPASRR